MPTYVLRSSTSFETLRRLPYGHAIYCRPGVLIIEGRLDNRFNKQFRINSLCWPF